MSSKEFIQRRKLKVEDRSVSWEVLLDNGENQRDSALMEERNSSLLLYAMNEAESRVWSDDSSIHHAHTEPNTLHGDHRGKRLYRRAESENLTSYLQGSIGRLTRSASVSSQGNRQVTKMLLQRELEKSLSTDHIPLTGGHRHAGQCPSLPLTLEDPPEPRAPPKRIYQLDRETVRAICASPSTHSHDASARDTPPRHWAGGDKGVFSAAAPEADREPGQADSQEDKILSVADAKRAFESASSSKHRAASCPAKPGGSVKP